jgi:nucleotide-binding universal stress UspA family protein
VTASTAESRSHRKLPAGAQRQRTPSNRAGLEFVRPDEIGRTAIGTNRGHEVTVLYREAAARKKASAHSRAPDPRRGGAQPRCNCPRLPRAMAPPEFKRIAVAVDGSPHGSLALDYAIDLAHRYGSQLSVLAVAPIQPVYALPNEPFTASAMPMSDLPRYQKIVEEAVARAEQAGVTAVTGLCEDGVVVDEILAFLDQHPTDLLVLGSRGLSAARRLLLGSVSTAMVTHAPCPVLVVRSASMTHAP